MTPEERRLIEDLFDRMRSYGSPEKDREAEYLIKERIRAMPDAAYMLTQSVLVQEQALQAANERVAELEDRIRELQESQEGPPPRRGGSFLGGAFSSNRERAPEARPSSVPQVGARATPSTYEQRPSVWGAGAPPPPPPQAPQAGGGGGFMRSAMATAAGVAGGVLVAESIRNMMGSGHARAGETSLGKDEHKQQLVDDSSSQQHHDEGSRDDHDDQQGQDDQQDQGEYDTAEDDSFDSDGDFGDDSIDV